MTITQAAKQYLGQSELPSNKFDTATELGKRLHEAGQHYELEISNSFHANGDKGVFMCTKALSATSSKGYILDVDEFDNI